MDLRSDEHGGSSHQLQFAAQNWHVRQKPVNERNGEEKRLVVNLVFLSDLNKPIDQNGAHTGSNIGLFPHVMRLGPMAFLFRTNMFSWGSWIQVENRNVILPHNLWGTCRCHEGKLQGVQILDGDSTLQTWHMASGFLLGPIHQSP